MAATAHDLERRVSSLEGDQRVMVANYEALLNRFIDNMDEEEKRAERLEKILNEIFVGLKDLREKAATMDEALEKRLKDHVVEHFVSKLDAEKIDRKISRIFWVATGISTGLSIAWVIILITTKFVGP